jgi:hypothetical protein
LSHNQPPFERGPMKEKTIILIILCCLIVVLTVADLGLYATNRLLVRNQTIRIQQIQAQINNRDKAVQEFVMQVKMARTIQEIQDILRKIK